jgi:exopolysaccharide biosynthesis polyprenyl glycosylphosphotransferase
MNRPPHEGPAPWPGSLASLPGLAWKKLLLQLWGSRGYLLFVLDLLVFFSSIILAYHLRYHVVSIVTYIPPQDPYPPPITPFLKAATVLTIPWLFILARSGEYRNAPQLLTSSGWQTRELINSGLLAFGLLMVLGVLYRGLLVSRVVYLLAFLIALLTAATLRLMLTCLESYLCGRDILKEKLVVIGGGRRATEFLDHLKSHNASIMVAGSVEPNPASDTGHGDPGLPILGGLREIAEVFRRTPFDSLLFIPDENGVSPRYLDRELMMLAVNFCESHNIPFYMVPDALGVAVTGREIDVCQGYPVIELRDASLHPGYKIVKRLMDIVGSTVVLLVGIPLWLLIALLIKLTTDGPVFYVQERAGLKGKPFKMLKFRTMVADADQRLKEIIDLDSLAEPVFKMNPDPRVTPIGKILRNRSLDEVPQFLNVLWGDMSLVGPRPEAVELVAKYNLWQRRRLKAKPGITGYQQIMSRGDPSLENRIALDLYYLKHQGLWLDLFILAKTIIVVIRGDGLK